MRLSTIERSIISLKRILARCFWSLINQGLFLFACNFPNSIWKHDLGKHKKARREVFKIVDLMDKIQKITDIGKTAREKQKNINVVEVFYIWDVLVTKLDALETLQIVEHMIEDVDLVIIKNKVKDGLVVGITDMEVLMSKYDLPFPMRPPADVSSTVHIEVFSDRDIFQMLYEVIAAFFPILGIGFMQSTTPDVRKSIKIHLLLTIELQEMLVEYGKLKGFLNEPPVYRP